MQYRIPNTTYDHAILK